MLLRRPMKLLMLSAMRLCANKQFSNIRRKLKWRKCLEILLMDKLNFTNRCVCPSLAENTIKLLTFLSTGYGRMGKNHTRNTTYTRGRLVAPYWFILLFSSTIVLFDTSLLLSTTGTFFFTLFGRSSLDIFSADSWTARESWKPTMSECCGRVKSWILHW